MEDLFTDGTVNAYQVLGLSPSCTQECIKSAFRELAKATHPDMQPGTPHPRTTARFLAILAAYQILSDPLKRAQYDSYLVTLSNSVGLDGGTKTEESFHNGGLAYTRRGNCEAKEMEVAEWLRWYRCMVADLLSTHEFGDGPMLEEYSRELRMALKAAYFGPYLDDTDLVPHCFEAEERAEPGVPDILHLVSGRHLFGAVRQVSEGVGCPGEAQKNVASLVDPSALNFKQLISGKWFLNKSTVSVTPLADEQVVLYNSGRERCQIGTKMDCSEKMDLRSCANLELHLFGRLVARATRAPPKQNSGTMPQNSSFDKISVYLCPNNFDSNTDSTGKAGMGSTFTTGFDKDSRDVLLGTIHGLNTAVFGGKCSVHAPDGRKTHVILQHKTPLVKHMRWFKINDEFAQFECKCTRARLPSSRFWLFEPRCDTHNVGGWYIETYGRNDWNSLASLTKRLRRSTNYSNNEIRSKGSTTSTVWEGNRSGSLHPAMYIIAAAYKTLDAEAVQRRKKSLISSVKEQSTLHDVVSKSLLWCKNRLSFLKRV